MKRHTNEEIGVKLQQADNLTSLGHGQRQIAKTLGVSTMTYYRWRKRRINPADHSGEGLLSRNNASPKLDCQQPPVEAHSLREIEIQLRELETENRHLRKLVTDLLLGKIQLSQHE